MNFTLTNDVLQKANDSEVISLPKYTSQLINWANQNAQGTRPRVVGQLSDLFPEYQRSTKKISLRDWKSWYLGKYPNSISDATDKIYGQIKNLQEAIKLIDRSLIEKWAFDLIITKTYNGMYVQKAILKELADRLHTTYRLANADEDSIGIDGYVGETAYSIKPISYKTMGRLSETIDVKMIYYAKTKRGLKIDVED